MTLRLPPKMLRDTRKVRFITLFELVLAMLLLVSVGAGVFYRADRFLSQQRFQKDSARLLRILHDTRWLAFYTKSDWQIRAEKKKKGWDVSFQCQEELKASSSMMKKVHLSPFELQLNERLVRLLTIEISSTGHVYPKGNLKILSPNGEEARSIELPSAFYQEGILSVGPAHPKELEI